MNQTIEVEIDGVGNIHPVDPTFPLPPGRAFLTWKNTREHEAMLLSEHALAENWLGPEEDAAWASFQRVK